MTISYSADLPEVSEKDREVHVSSTSIHSNNTEPTLADLNFKSGTRLQIYSRGRALIRLPTPSSELEIPILSPEGQTQYLSTRAKRCSGDAVLSHSKRGDLISTTYFFGPNREPVIKILQPLDVTLDTIKVASRWTSRATSFTTPDGKEFEWSYVKSRNEEGEKMSMLVLRYVQTGIQQDMKAGEKGAVVAKLVRGDETRTPGTGRMTAGNGGELVFDLDAADYLAEEVVIATCLMMLKKEIDRRRAMQFAMMAGAVGGGT